MRIVEEKTEGIRARTILWYMTFFGFAVNYIIRINASIAIVDMIDVSYKKASDENRTIITSECIVSLNATGEFQNKTHEDDGKNRYVSMERRFLDYFEVRVSVIFITLLIPHSP